MKNLIKEIKPYVNLYRDSKTGIAWVENGCTGNEHSCHPNIDTTGSVRGMKKLGYWDRNDVIIQTNGAKYNISKFAADDELDNIAAENCLCEKCRERKGL